MLLAGWPPALVKLPPTYTAVTEAANALTSLSEPGTPDPKADHAVPFHRAMLLAGLPPALVKLPPTYKLVPETASALTAKYCTWPGPCTPDPKADQALPSHFAM